MARRGNNSFRLDPTGEAAGLMGVAPENEADARDWQDQIAAPKARAPKPKGR